MGITDERIVRLRRIGELQMATALPDGSAPSEAFEGVHVVEGSIRRDGDDLRTTIRLLDPDGAVLWSEAFDRTIFDLMEVQEEIARAIANNLSVSLEVGPNSREFGGTVSNEALAEFILGSLSITSDPPQSRLHLERATELDP